MRHTREQWGVCPETEADYLLAFPPGLEDNWFCEWKVRDSC